MNNPLPLATSVTRGSGPRWPDWWCWLAGGILAIEILLWIVPQFRPGPLGLVCWLLGSDRLLWLFAAAVLAILALAWSLWKRPLINRWRVVGGLLIGLVAVAPQLLFRVYPSRHDGRPSEIRFRLPLDGPILVGWGGGTPRTNYHVVAPDQRWAYDLLVAKNGKTHREDGSRCEDYFCYGFPVLAPADGVVHSVMDGTPDQPIGVLGGEPAGGNQIVLKAAKGQFLFLCHLQRGSIAIKEGERVTAGQPLAKVGNSGNTSEPHLHIHLQDTPRLHLGEGIPLYFHGYRVNGQLIERGIPTGGFSRGQPIGQVVEHAGEQTTSNQSPEL